MTTVENKTKNCKVIATYFGTRRHYPHNYEGTIEVLKDSIKNEVELDPGVNHLDIIIVNHDCGNKEGKKFLKKIDGTKTFCGKIIVISRDWEEGKGISLGSFDYAFKKFKNKYDYWFFQEDDYKLVKKNYYGNGVKILENQPLIGFLGYDMGATIYVVKHKKNIELRFAQFIFYLPILFWGYKKYLKRFNRTINESIDLIKRNKLYYAGGMMGLTTQKNLKMVLEKYGRLPHPRVPMKQHKEKFKNLQEGTIPYYLKTFFYYNRYMTGYFLYAVLGELEFSRVYYDFGLRISSYPDYKKLIYSYKRKRFK